MAIEFNIPGDLAIVEQSIVDWKRRVKDYEDKGLPVPQHVTARIEMLKKDARLMRKALSLDGETE